MSKVLYEDKDYKILYSSFNGYVLLNKNGEYENHGHFKKFSTCKLLIKLMNEKKVPSKSKYLQESVLRISTDEKYIQKVLNRQEKDRNRTYYINSNKGVR